MRRRFVTVFASSQFWSAILNSGLKFGAIGDAIAWIEQLPLFMQIAVGIALVAIAYWVFMVVLAISAMAISDDAHERTDSAIPRWRKLLYVGVVVVSLAAVAGLQWL